MKPLTLRETVQRLRCCGDAYVLIHANPDGDCIGGGHALAEILRQMGKRAKVICNDPIPNRYSFMLPKTEPADFVPHSILSIDVADPKLFGKDVQEKYGDRVDLCIDHHASHVEFAREGYVDGSAAAACEIVCQMLIYLPEVQMTDYIASCLYTGIATDTGCFQYDNTSALTHLAIADLMTSRPHVRYSQINRLMFTVKSMGRLKLDQMLTDRLERFFDGKCVLICLEREVLDRLGVENAELESVANFPLQVEGAEVGVTMKELQKGKFRISMRSADRADVASICQKLGGGGHIKASGCTIIGTEEYARDILIKAVEEGLKEQCIL